jgi:hypothetical protein
VCFTWVMYRIMQQSNQHESSRGVNTDDRKINKFCFYAFLSFKFLFSPHQSGS